TSPPPPSLPVALDRQTVTPSRRNGNDPGQICRYAALAKGIVSPGDDRPVRLERQTVIPSRRDLREASSWRDIRDHLPPPTENRAGSPHTRLSAYFNCRQQKQHTEKHDGRATQT